MFIWTSSAFAYKKISCLFALVLGQEPTLELKIWKVFFANIRWGWKGLPRTIILAYLAKS